MAVKLRPASPASFAALLLLSYHSTEAPAQTAPVYVTNTSSWYGCLAVGVSGSTLFAANRYDSTESAFSMFNVSNAAIPTNLGYNDSRHTGQALALSGNLAYLVDSGGLRILDFSNPANPVLVGHMDGNWYSIAVSGHYAYLSSMYDSNANSVVIYDVSNPANLVQLGAITNGEWECQTAVSGNYAYVAGFGQGLLVSDVSDPLHPKSVARINAGSFLDVEIAGHYAYLAIGTNANNQWIYDISNPTNPVPVFRTPASDWSLSGAVAVSGNYAYVIAGLKLFIYDISNPTNATLASQTPLAGGVASGRTLALHRGYAYVAYTDGVAIYSLGNPAPPKLTLSTTPTNTLILSWPAPAPGFAVQQETAVDSSAAWETLTNGIATLGSNNMVAIPAPESPRFYRLISQ